MSARKNRPGKHGTGDTLNTREREFLVEVFRSEERNFIFGEYGAIHYSEGFMNGYSDVAKGLITRGIVGTRGMPDSVFSLTERGAAIWRTLDKTRVEKPLFASEE